MAVMEQAANIPPAHLLAMSPVVMVEMAAVVMVVLVLTMAPLQQLMAVVAVVAVKQSMTLALPILRMAAQATRAYASSAYR